MQLHCIYVMLCIVFAMQERYKMHIHCIMTSKNNVYAWYLVKYTANTL